MVKGHAQPDMCWTSLAPLHVDMILSLVAAKSIVDAAIIRSARELDIKICVAVCDHQGNLIALNRMDVEDANHWQSGHDNCGGRRATARGLRRLGPAREL